MEAFMEAAPWFAGVLAVAALALPWCGLAQMRRLMRDIAWKGASRADLAAAGLRCTGFGLTAGALMGLAGLILGAAAVAHLLAGGRFGVGPGVMAAFALAMLVAAGLMAFSANRSRLDAQHMLYEALRMELSGGPDGHGRPGDGRP